MRSLWKAGVAALIAVELILAGCGDTYRPIVTPVVPPGGDPQSFNAVIILNQNPDGTQPGSVSELNVAGDTMSNSKPVGKNPVAVAFDASRSTVFAANKSSDSVTATTISSFTAVTLFLKQGSQPVAVTGLRSGTVYSANSGANEDCGTGSVSFINATGVALTNVCLPSPPKFLLEATGNNRKLYAICEDGKIRIISIDTAAVIGSAISVGTNPIQALLSLDESQMYVLNKGSNDITVVDVASDSVVTPSIALGGSSPSSMALDKRLNRLYVANTGSDSVTILNTANTPITVLRTVTLDAGSAPTSIAVRNDGAFAYVANSGKNYMTEINGTSFQTLNINAFSPTLDAAVVPTLRVTSTAISADGTKAYATVVEPTNKNNGTAVIKTSDHSWVTTLQPPLTSIFCDPTVTGNTCPTERQRPTVLVPR